MINFRMNQENQVGKNHKILPFCSLWYLYYYENLLIHGMMILCYSYHNKNILIQDMIKI